MGRAQQKGTRFETAIAEELSRLTGQAVHREPKHGSRDEGDVTGLVGGYGSHVGITIECKNRSRLELSEWLREAEREAENHGDEVGVVAFKRRGVGDPGRQYVLMTVRSLALLTGDPEEAMGVETPVLDAVNERFDELYAEIRKWRNDV